MTKYRPQNLRMRDGGEKRCKNCNRPSKYRCPKSRLLYCSSSCYKKIQQGLKDGKFKAADPPKEEKTPQKPPKREHNSGEVPVDVWAKYDDENDRLPKEKLESLETSEEVKNLLANPHLRQMITHINAARNKDRCMEKAMQEPIFVEFAEACLKMVETDSSDEEKSPEPMEEAVDVKEFELVQF